MCTCMHVPEKPEEGAGSPEAGITGIVKVHDMGAGSELGSSIRVVSESVLQSHFFFFF